VAEIKRLRDAAWEAIGSATVDSEQRQKYWTAWEGHCKMYQTSSKGKTPHNAREMLLTFAVAVWEGKYGLGRQI
jgi:hypothetical protein